MPNIKSAKKRMRQNRVRRIRNRAVRSNMHTEIKELRKMISEKNLDQAQLQLKRVYSVIDRTAQKGMIHPNTGARYKSRLSRLFD